jgi:hypothetical protein
MSHSQQRAGGSQQTQPRATTSNMIDATARVTRDREARRSWARIAASQRPGELNQILLIFYKSNFVFGKIKPMASKLRMSTQNISVRRLRPCCCELCVPGLADYTVGFAALSPAGGPATRCRVIKVESSYHRSMLPTTHRNLHYAAPNRMRSRSMYMIFRMLFLLT